jgi:hypothetical protein
MSTTEGKPDGRRKSPRTAAFVKDFGCRPLRTVL